MPSMIILGAFLLSCTSCMASDWQETVEFQAVSKDGTEIGGVFESSSVSPQAIVVLIPGTGLHGRDYAIGKSKTEGDKIFKTLGVHLRSRGLATVRYDGRGVHTASNGALEIDRSLASTGNVANRVQDLAAVYDWARARSSQGPACLILLAHSEGMRWVGGLAQAGLNAPDLIVGLGPLMRSPVAVMRWQLAERTISSIQAMDTNNDGTVSDEELATGWPSSWMYDLQPNTRRLTGPIGPERLRMLERFGNFSYQRAHAMAMAAEDTTPFPSANSAEASAGWWKSWFVDEQSVASMVAAWKTPLRLYYGRRDSQLAVANEAAEAERILKGQVATHVYDSLGHTLGTSAIYGPMSSKAISDVVGEVANFSRDCRSPPV